VTIAEPLAESGDLVIGPEVEVRGAEALSADEIEMLERAGLLGDHPIEAWTVLGSNRDVGYSTHSLFRYFGKFPPPIAGHLIRSHTGPGDLVRDPTAGSGTTGVESVLHGRECELSDINPLCALIARVKTRHVDEDKLLEALGRVSACYCPLDSSDADIEPIGLRNVEHWFLPETIRSLRGLRFAVELELSPLEREFLRLSFASTVRRVSRATTQQGRQFLDAETALEDAWPVFERNARRAAKSVGALPADSAVKVSQLDALVPQSHAAPAALTILHPPYFNAYKYSSINSFEMAWLGYLRADVRKAEIREAFKTATTEKVAAYVDDIENLLMNASNTTAPGGTVGLMIGDTVLRGEYLPIVARIIDRLPAGLGLASVALRIPRHTEATWVTSQRRNSGDIGVRISDFVLTFTVSA
jgi:hypothetical protein